MKFSNSQQGSAMAITVVMVILLMALSGATLSLTITNHDSSEDQMKITTASQHSEDGLAIATDFLNTYMMGSNLNEPNYFNSNIGDRHIIQVSVEPNNNEYYLFEILDDGDPSNTGSANDVKIIRSTGYSNGFARSVEYTVCNNYELRDQFQNAIYAGNTSGDPNYNLDLGGTGNSADVITGPIFSNSDINFNGDSWEQFIMDRQEGSAYSVAGQNINIRTEANRLATSTSDINIENDMDDLSRALPNGQAQDAPITRSDIDQILADFPDYVVNVSTEFNGSVNAQAASTTNFTNSNHRNNFAAEYGHNLDIIDNEDNPAHIFTRGFQNSTGYDGSNDVSANGDNTYHLLDPFDTQMNGKSKANSAPVSLTGVNINRAGGETPNQGNMKIYYIEGDLWIHDHNSYDFQLKHSEPDGMKVAFIVKGDIFFSDNLFWNNQNYDMFMFMAIQNESDPNGDSSGNIHIGDPQFGTVEEIDAMLYAEHDFIENNITAAGSSEFVINGNMTAGNQVNINRDSDGNHSQMVVNYENRLTQDSQQAQNFRDQMPDWMRTLIYRNYNAQLRKFSLLAWRSLPSSFNLRSSSANTIWNRSEIVTDIQTNNTVIMEGQN